MPMRSAIWPFAMRQSLPTVEANPHNVPRPQLEAQQVLVYSSGCILKYNRCGARF